jgi:predicted nucleic acid-binding protein
LIVFFDTSALLKRYVAEADSEAVAALWKNAATIAASHILYAEAVAAFARRRRELPATADALDQAQQAFRQDWPTIHRVAVDDAIDRRVDDLLTRHTLRGADAIHLASALLVRDALQQPVTFACADTKLIAAARAEGLVVEP